MAFGGAGTSADGNVVLRLLLDMNLTPDWIRVLQDSGIEAVHWSQVGDATATDQVIMEFARENGFVVVTQDLDFTAILALTQTIAPSVVQTRAQHPVRIANRIIAAIRLATEELLSGAILTITDDGSTRVRILPFS